MISKILTKTGGAKKSKTNEKKKVVKKTKTKSKGKAKVSKKTKTKSKGKVAKKSKSKSKGKKKVQKGGATDEQIIQKFTELFNQRHSWPDEKVWCPGMMDDMNKWYNSIFTKSHGRTGWYDIKDEEINRILPKDDGLTGDIKSKFKKLINWARTHSHKGGAKKYKSKSKSKSKAKVAKKSKSKSKSKAKVAKKSKSKSKGKKVKREPNMFIKTLMEVKKHVKKMDLPEDVKDGPAMSKVVSAVMKAKDMDAKKSVEHIKDNFSKFLNDYKKTQHEMQKKREAKKAAKSA